MRFRIAMTSVICAASALALASLMTVWTTHGSGSVRNSAGRTAGFRVEASKKVHGTLAPQIHGSLVLEFIGTTNVEGERLTMEVRDYAQDGNTSHASGPAIWRRHTPAGWQEVHGHARAKFASHRHPDEPSNAPDMLEVHFLAPTSTSSFSFGGAVVRGDITIAKTESY